MALTLGHSNLITCLMESPYLKNYISNNKKYLKKNKNIENNIYVSIRFIFLAI